MSECVVRMEMPKSCYDCEIRDGKAYCPICGATLVGYKRSRHENCPIICSLPEGHGDLISRYAIAIACPGQIRIEDGEYWIRVSAVQESIKSAPTIVPAERSEE